MREIVRSHHGTAEVTSTWQDRTTFTVTLPKAALGTAPESGVTRGHVSRDEVAAAS
jgi:nitrogen-specific signal transduction histidine kinase